MSQPWYEVGKWSIDVNMGPVLGESLTEFASRIDESLFRRLTAEAICIVDSAPTASTVRVMGSPRPATERQDEDRNIYLIIFRPDIMRLSPKAALGEVAHQFAHLVLRLEHGVDSESLPAGDEMADNLAISWGFREEIGANKAERELLQDGGAAAGQEGRQATGKPPRRKRNKVDAGQMSGRRSAVS